MNISSEVLLTILGNPLLDISAKTPFSLNEKYSLPLNTTVLAQEQHMPLYKELQESYSCQYLPGGSAQNTARAAQWLLMEGHRGSVSYFGCVGRDEYARTLETKMKEQTVRTFYSVSDNEPTGTCAALINGTNRCLVPNLGAACSYPTSHLVENWEEAIRGKMFYLTAYFISTNKEATLMIAKHTAEFKKVLAFNLAATFWIEAFLNDLKEFLPYMHILMGNAEEFQILAGALQLNTTNFSEIASAILKMMSHQGEQPPMVIITRGSESTLWFSHKEETGLFKIEAAPEELPAEKLIDTNGAGDAFAGGFLAAFALGKPIEQCLQFGNYVAREVIQQDGAVLPPEPKMELTPE